jgi:hypothetical protein
MRVRLVAIAVLATAALAACSSSSSGKGSVQTSPAAGTNSSSPNAPATGSSGAGSHSASSGGGSDTALCAQLGHAQTEIQGLDADISDPAALKTALDKEAGVLASLKAAAPPELSAALDDLSTLLTGAEQALANPAAPDLTKLEALATQIPADAAKIEAYVEKNCPGVEISASLP